MLTKLTMIAAVAKWRLVRIVTVHVRCSESVVWECQILTILNGRSGEFAASPKVLPPQLQTNAASATWPNVNVRKVPQSRPSPFENAALTGQCLLLGKCDAAIGHRVNGGYGP